ncbi:MAG TPA: flagellar assembly protein FliX [Magnetospirillaceae bacterium]|nr:flagellar assembly protein FliX [Magnetospirillaceae bacterium]
MKLTGIGGASAAGPASKTAKTTKTSGGGFAESLASLDQAEETQGVETPAAVGGIAALIATQQVGDALDREAKKRLVDYGNDLLDKLEELRHGLLMGAIPKDKLIAMAQMVRSRRDHVPDPHLAELLNEIELRVEVELAKLSARDP